MAHIYVFIILRYQLEQHDGAKIRNFLTASLQRFVPGNFKRKANTGSKNQGRI